MVVKAKLVSSKAVLVGLVACGLLTGCGGFVTEQEATQIRSLLEELEVVRGDLPATDSGNEDVVDAPTSGADDPVVDSGSDTPTEEPTDVVDTSDPITEDEVVDAPANDPVDLNTLSLTWTPSDFFEDGSAMSVHEIAHYKVVYGSSPDALTESQEVGLGNLLTFEMQGDVGSTWYAAVKTISVYGSESASSNVIALNF